MKVIKLLAAFAVVALSTSLAFGQTGNYFAGTGAGENTTGDYNTLVGYYTGYFNATGSNNTFLGSFAGGYNTAGSDNTFIGGFAGYHAQGSGNTFIGRMAGRNSYTGNQNTFLGHSAGYNNSTGEGNVFLGYQAGHYETGSNKLYIANSSTATPLIFGDFSTGRVGIGTTIPSYELDVAGTAQVTNFRMLTGAADGYVLQSDGFGNASWVDPVTLADGDWTISDTNMYSNVVGNVGIGITNPSYKLDVAGDINLTGNLYQNGILFKSSLWNENGSDIYYDSGNVGIGTSTPQAALDVRDTTGIHIGANQDLQISTTTSGDVMIRNTVQNGDFSITTDTSGVDVTNFYVDASAVKVGIGTKYPKFSFTTVGIGNGFMRYSDISAQAANSIFARARGTEENPVALQNGDKIGTFGFIGFDGNSQNDFNNIPYAAAIMGYVDATPGTGLIPGRLEFATRDKDQGTIPITRLVIDNKGRIFAPDLGKTSDVNPLNVVGLDYDISTGQLVYNPSSERYKENFADLDTADSKWIYDIDVQKFNFIGSTDTSYGVKAEDVELIRPQIVRYAIFDNVSGERIRGYDNIAQVYDELVPNTPENKTFFWIDGSGVQQQVNIQVVKLAETVDYSQFTMPMLKELQDLKNGGDNDWALSVTGDTLYSYADSTVVIDAVGNRVGIGTTAPQAALDVRDTTGIHIGTNEELQLSTTTLGDVYIGNKAEDKDVMFTVNNSGVEDTVMHFSNEKDRVIVNNSLYINKDGNNNAFIFFTGYTNGPKIFNIPEGVSMRTSHSENSIFNVRCGLFPEADLNIAKGFDITQIIRGDESYDINNVYSLSARLAVKDSYHGNIRDYMGIFIQRPLFVDHTGPEPIFTNVHGLWIGDMYVGEETNYAVKTNMGIVDFGDKLFASLGSGFGNANVRYNTVSRELTYQLSSERYKENITDVKDENTEWIFDVNIKEFEYKDDPDNKIQLGVIVEEVEDIRPQIVAYALFEDNGDGTYNELYNYDNMSDYFDIPINTTVTAVLEKKDEEYNSIFDTLEIIKIPETVDYSEFTMPMLKELQDLKAGGDNDWTIDGDTLYSAADSTVFIDGVNGKVGIGTTNPSQKLDVAGTTLTENLVVSKGADNDPALLFMDNAGDQIWLDNGDVRVTVHDGYGNFAIKHADHEDKYISASGAWKFRGDNAGKVYLQTALPGTIGDAIAWNNFVMDNMGNIGIGNTSPSYKLDVAGNVYCTGSYLGSDKRLKKNIRTIPGALDKILALNGTNYEFKTDEFKSKNFNEGNHYGFIAQELKQVLPELVKEDVDGFYAVNYDGVIPVLVEAMKEQDNRIEELEKEIAELKQLINQGAAGLDNNIVLGNDHSKLYQNNPNPFSQQTEINYYLPNEISNAIILIFDMNGKQIKRYDIAARGNDKVIIHGNELAPGMYMYSLIADNKLIDTKRMVLTQ